MAEALTPMSEIAERLGRMEAHHENTVRVIDALVSGQKVLQDAITDLVREVADLAAAIRHPDPAHCLQTHRMIVLEADVARLQDDAAAMKQLGAEAAGRKQAWAVIWHVLSALAGAALSSLLRYLFK